MKKIFTSLFILFLVGICNLSAQTYNGGVWYSLYDDTESSVSTTTGLNNHVTIKSNSIFIPSTGALSFDTKMTKAGLINPSDYKILVGGQTVDVASKQTDYITKSTTIDASLTSLEFKLNYKSYNSGRKVYIKNVKLPLAQHIILAEGQDTKTFDDVVVDGQSAPQTITLRSFLSAGDITIKSSDNAFRINSASNLSGAAFMVGANACASANGSGEAAGENLGDINNYTFSIYFCPSEAKTYNATITLTDGVSTATINVSGTGLKKNQIISWAADYTADDITLPIGKIVENAATAISGLDVTYSSDNEAVIQIVNEGKAFQAIAEGTATITAEQAGDDLWNAAEPIQKVFAVTGKKVQVIAWTDNLTRLKVGGEPVTLTATANVLTDVENELTEEAPERTALITYASADEAVVSVEGNILTIVGEGQTTLTATLPGDEIYQEAVVTMPVRVRVPSTTCESYLLDAPDEVSYSAPFGGSYEPASWTAPAHQLTFEARIGNATAVGNVEVQQYVNGEWQEIDDFMPKTSWNVYGPYDLDRNATKVRFYSNGSFNRFIKNVLVSQATYLETTTPAITVGESVKGDIIEKTIAVQYSNIPAGIEVSNTSAKLTLSNIEFDNDCGTYGEHLITLKVIPTEVGTILDTVTIFEELTASTLIIPVEINTQRYTQTIIWEDSIDTIHATDNITLTATARTPITYISSDSTIAYVDEANQLIINSIGSVIITAYAAESEDYQPAQLSKKVEILHAQASITNLPTVQPITYGTALTNDMLVGGEANIEGYFAWNVDPEQELLPGEHSLPIQFIPTTNMIYGVIDTIVSVTITKAAQTIVWEDDFSNLTISDTITLTASAMTDIYYEVLEAEIAHVEDNQLTFFMAGEVTVMAIAQENDYYLGDTISKTIFVNAALDESIVTAYPTATSITYGQSLSESLLEGGMASVEGEFQWQDGSLMLSAGDHVMTALFIPVEQDLYANVELYVEVTVAPAAQSITWELDVPVQMIVGEVLELTASASSGLQVIYTLDNEGIATVENDCLIAHQAGSFTITASQDGLDYDGFYNYLAAEPVSYFVQVLADDIHLGVDNLSSDSEKAYKVIRNGQLFIIRGEQIFDALGNLID